MTEHHPYDGRDDDLPLWQRKKPRRKARCLELLQSKTIVTTSQLVAAIGHRFSTIIEALRLDGHVIDACDLGNEWEYKYIRREPVVKTPPTFEQRYYKTSHWRRIRELRLKWDEYKCANCHKTATLEVHHWKYDLFHERLGDLMTLCDECHRRIHGVVSIVFPRSITERIKHRVESEVA